MQSIYRGYEEAIIAMGLFNIYNTKKDMTVWTIFDFRDLNILIVRRPYPIPKISTTLQKLGSFTYVTALDMNMGYYTIRMDPMTVEMCTIIFPWGKYSHLRLWE